MKGREERKGRKMGDDELNFEKKKIQLSFDVGRLPSILTTFEATLVVDIMGRVPSLAGIGIGTRTGIGVRIVMGTDHRHKHKDEAKYSVKARQVQGRNSSTKETKKKRGRQACLSFLRQFSESVSPLFVVMIGPGEVYAVRCVR